MKTTKENLFDLASKKFISDMQDSSITISDIQYYGGYFIFDFEASNAVMHFNIDGCKNWKFGIWWNYDKDKLTGEFFCQHKRYLDKFKPSYSIYNYTIEYQVKDGQIVDDGIHYNIMQIANACRFIKSHPYLAAMKDFRGYDYNVVKQRPVRAFVEYYYDGFKKSFRESMHYRFDMIMKRQLEKYAAKSFSGYSWEVIDEGECTSPRYELQVLLPDNDEQKTGRYGLFEDDDLENKNAWKKKKNRLRKISDFLGAYWYNGVSDSLVFWKECEYKEWLDNVEE